MSGSHLSSLDLFKIACISEDEFSDEELKTFMMNVIIANEIDIEEFLGILKEYRPNIHKGLISQVVGKANSQKTIDENSFDQKVSVVFRSLNSHNPTITKDMIRKVAEEFVKGEE